MELESCRPETCAEVRQSTKDDVGAEVVCSRCGRVAAPRGTRPGDLIDLRMLSDEERVQALTGWYLEPKERLCPDCGAVVKVEAARTVYTESAHVLDWYPGPSTDEWPLEWPSEVGCSCGLSFDLYTLGDPRGTSDPHRLFVAAEEHVERALRIKALRARLTDSVVLRMPDEVKEAARAAVLGTTPVVPPAPYDWED